MSEPLTVPDPSEGTTYSVSAIRRRDHPGPRPRVESAADVHALLETILRDADREYFYVVLLSSKHDVLALELVSVGTLSASIVHAREVFKLAIVQSTAAIVLVHNHPSGDLTPSPEDIAVTRRLAQAGELLGIRVLDHVVIFENEYISLRDEGCFSPCKEDGCPGF